MIAEQFAGADSKGNAAFALAIFFIKSAFSKGLISLAAAQQYVKPLNQTTGIRSI